MCYHSIDLCHPLTAAVASVGSCFGQLLTPQPGPVSQTRLDLSRDLQTCISERVTLVIQWAPCSVFLAQIAADLMSRLQIHCVPFTLRLAWLNP